MGVFRTGTVEKQNIFQFMIDELTAAGWKQISTSIANDGYVFYSTGKTGNKKIYLNMRPHPTNGFNVLAQGDRFCIRGVKSYIPNPSESGPGTFEFRIGNASTWYDLALISYYGGTAIPLSVQFKYYVYTDLDKIILFLEAPAYLGMPPKCAMVYLGAANSFCIENQGQNSTFLSTGYYYYFSTTVNFVGSVKDESGAAKTYAQGDFRYQAAPINPDAHGTYYLSPLFLGDSTEGLRCVFEDFYVLPNSNSLSHGDEIVIDYTVYKVIKVNAYGNSYWYSNLPETTLAVRIS
jgi:hypothetical protein